MSEKTPEVREALAVYATEAPETELVPPGYRQSEVGVIPEDWIALPISEIVQNIIDYRGRTPRKLGMTWGGGNIPALSARNVKMGFIDFEEETYFGTEALYKRWMNNGDPKKNDLVVTMEAPLGNVALIPDDQKYILSQRTVLLQTNQHKVISKYLVQLMRSKSFQKLLSENATGSTATGIQRRKLERLEVLLPPIPEQRAIAAALSDVDALISALDKLIAKKRAVKTAAMQQLLTGKQRLPGFSGEWEVKLLKDVAPLQRGFDLPNSMLRKGYHPVVYSNGILNYHADFMVKGPGVVTGRSGTIGKVSYVEEDYWPHNTALWVTDFKGNSPEFVYRLYQGIGLDQFGTGSGVPTLNRNDVHAFSVGIPSSEEQTAIAAVLSDMDAEIAALEARREKTRQVKQGMMQELLTGRTRLV